MSQHHDSAPLPVIHVPMPSLAPGAAVGPFVEPSISPPPMDRGSIFAGRFLAVGAVLGVAGAVAGLLV